METEVNNVKDKKKRVRNNPVKKWSPAEENALVNFLLENKHFEKPTAQAYYKKFCEQKNVFVYWKLVRSKVRNMRVSYNKAKAFELSTEAASTEETTVKSTILKICSFYDEFDAIFGSRIENATIVEESLDSELPNPTKMEFEEYTITPQSSQYEIKVLPTLPSESRKGIYSRTAVSEIMKMQLEIIALKREKISHDLEIKEKEVYMKEKEISLKERELELKEKEINSNERLKILELEMKERIAREELKLKYK